MNKDKEIIAPVSRDLLLEELTGEHLLRKTNNAQNEIYVVDAHACPHVMQEVGRLRELSFRQAGGGTGKEADVDGYDIAPVPYNQLIVWDPGVQEIVGGYRFMRCWEVETDAEGTPRIATSELFRFSDQFNRDYLPNVIELGRSFVQPSYQPSRENRKSIYSLDNLWDGLGALIVKYPQLKFFIGKVTMYQHFDPFARDLILYFMQQYFPDPDGLVRPLDPLPLYTPEKELAAVYTGNTFEDNYKLLSQTVRERGENIPPLFNSYMGLSPSMRSFGTALNKGFGGVEETGIMVTIDDIYPAKTKRHVGSYTKP